ncbi:MAG: recombinase family protein [Pseudomonadota bacterium]|nr:recombinase family protein [Pseudomonadota bacterium]
MRRAALYLRSSKDRHDISIDAQRSELNTLAQKRGLVVDEFSDAVESGSTDQRPGFQALIRAMKDRARKWDVVLVLDTSRIARGRYIAQAFRHECKKAGVEILFSKVPEVDPISQVILESVLEAMDEVHSIMSREKGMAGMAENVRQGYRAGGRAPYGYRLEHIETGTMRDGAPVTKSRLVQDVETAPRIAAYLKARAKGMPAVRAAELAGVTLTSSGLVGIEWNALTYAGHSVWGQLSERPGQPKRRPRAEWIIQRDTTSR